MATTLTLRTVHCARGTHTVTMTGADDKFTPTYESHLTLTNTPLTLLDHSHSSRPAARSGSHRHGDGDTPAAPKRRVGPVDGPPQPIWPIVGPPKLAPEGGPGPGGGQSSKGTWTYAGFSFSPSALKQSFKNTHKSSCQVWGGCPPQSNGIATQVADDDELVPPNRSPWVRY